MRKFKKIQLKLDKEVISSLSEGDLSQIYGGNVTAYGCAGTGECETQLYGAECATNEYHCGGTLIRPTQKTCNESIQCSQTVGHYCCPGDSIVQNTCMCDPATIICVDDSAIKCIIDPEIPSNICFNTQICL